MLSCGVSHLGVAILEEGIELREAGIDAPILVLGGILGNQIEHFINYDLEICASSVFKLKAVDEVAAALGKKAKVHLKLDTGMSRIGVRWDHAASLFDAAVAAKNIEICGVFSHFANSDGADFRFARVQLQRFNAALEYFPQHGLPMPCRHIANSGAVLQMPEAYLDMVRPGILPYGVYPSPDCQRTIEVKPLLSYRTRVVYFKVIAGGTTVGYDRTWTAPDDTRVVTLPVGYGDGYLRALSNRGAVLIRGHRYPIVGRVSMDQCTVDIGQGSAYIDDEVVLIGEQGDEKITVEELAEWMQTIPYEVLTLINNRVPRVYKESGKDSSAN